MIGIYKIHSKVAPDRVYIGSSIKIEHRRERHLKDLRCHAHHAIKFQRHYDKYGIDDLVFSVLTICDKESVRKSEQEFLNLYKPYFNSGHVVNGCYTKIPWNKGLKGAQVCWKKGLKMPEEQRLKMMGHPVSEATREKIRIKKTGVTTSDLAIKKMAESKSKPVYQINKDGDIIAIFPSVQQAAKKTWCVSSNISECCRHGRKSAGGFQWEYAPKETTDITKEERNHLSISIGR
jgi:group I intron endonuclease